jgi:hypothetical protein
MEVTRIYKNASDEVIRIDTIQMIKSANTLVCHPSQMTFTRKIKTELVHESLDRTIYDINLITDADSVDFDPSAFSSHNWVEWTNSGPNGVRCNMSDLPQIGETV